MYIGLVQDVMYYPIYSNDILINQLFISFPRLQSTLYQRQEVDSSDSAGWFRQNGY